MGNCMKTYRKLLLGVILLAGSSWHAAATALEISWTGQPTTFPLTMSQAQIIGFGEFRFGMNQQQVESLISTTWPQARVEQQVDPVQRTTMLVFNVDDLAPVEEVDSPAPATMTFIFGYRSEQLMAINLDWYAEGHATEAQRLALLEAGSAYAALMLGDYWAPMQSSRGHILGDGTVLLFAGRDTQGRGVEVVVQGVALDVSRADGGIEHRPAPAGDARLHIGLSSMPDEPDIFRLPAGSF